MGWPGPFNPMASTGGAPPPDDMGGMELKAAMASFGQTVSAPPGLVARRRRQVPAAMRQGFRLGSRWRPQRGSARFGRSAGGQEIKGVARAQGLGEHRQCSVAGPDQQPLGGSDVT